MIERTNGRRPTRAELERRRGPREAPPWDEDTEAQERALNRPAPRADRRAILRRELRELLWLVLYVLAVLAVILLLQGIGQQ